MFFKARGNVLAKPVGEELILYDSSNEAVQKTHPKYKHIKFPYPNNNLEDYEAARLKLVLIILDQEIAGAARFKGRIAGPPQAAVDQITGY